MPKDKSYCTGFLTYDVPPVSSMRPYSCSFSNRGLSWDGGSFVLTTSSSWDMGWSQDRASNTASSNSVRANGRALCSLLLRTSHTRTGCLQYPSGRWLPCAGGRSSPCSFLNKCCRGRRRRPALLRGQISRNEGAAAQGRLGHDDAAAQAGDDAVAGREIHRQGRTPKAYSLTTEPPFSMISANKALFSGG